MEVKLLAHTPNPEEICAKAMRGCRLKKAAFEIKELDKPVEYYIRLAKEMGHVSVLEHATFTFSIKGISRSCTHQLVRHRIASYSQQSLRATKPSGWIMPDTIELLHRENRNLYLRVVDFIAESNSLYDDLAKEGVPKEDARFIMPIGVQTNIVVTMNATELLHFFYLRLSKYAQWEIREMAKRMLDAVRPIAPTIFEDAGKYRC